MQALGQPRDWPRLLATVALDRRHATRHLYLRQVDVPGVDTKFIETQRLACRTAGPALPAGRVDIGPPAVGLRRALSDSTATVLHPAPHPRDIIDAPRAFSELTVRDRRVVRG